MYSLNKFIGLITSPIVVAMMAVFAAVVLALFKWKRMARWMVVGALVWLWFWASPATYRWLASGLEREAPVVRIEDVPQADAIVILGGGVGSNTNNYPYSEMWFSADRVWHGARLYKAGKATNVFVTCNADISLLTDLGVPRSAINNDSMARNTEEEARFIAETMKQVEVKGLGLQRKVKILLVTSAWHMRRAKLMFEKYAEDVEVIPVAADYEALVRCGWKTGFSWSDLIPDAESLSLNGYMVKEIIGYWGYWWMR